MRSDQTAEFVATRPYIDDRARRRAINEHNRRVVRARRDGGEEKLAAEALLTMSGTTIFFDNAWECRKCQHLVGALFAADSDTHRIVNRSGNPVRPGTGLCVRCWSATVRYECDDPDLPIIEIRWG
ncbi:hypothetical protein [Streptomyces chryseus]|uniref:hypothetical protein n=1 Tax=Streptomyces chryseus TaxID=68186 RepID=UPI00110FA162|nr:hypothetical protein [Streptomyces chryseus]GGX26594.1 hypothetical protein GCM10010353_47050 [Streptomyces chryseus]